MQAAPECCPVCFSSSWSLANGVLVCEACGTQSQAFVEEAQEFQVGVDDSRFRRRQQRSTVERGTKFEGDRDSTPEAAAIQKLMAVYCQCLQRCLQGQVAALQHSCGVGQALSSVVRRCWLAYVAKSGILAESFARDVEHMLQEPQSAGDAKRQRLNWRVALRTAAWKVLHPDVTLAVCFLGCWVLREAVTPMDVVRWASDATLPFLRLPSLAAELLHDARESGCDLPLSWLRPTGVMGTQDLMVLATEVAAELAMQLPPVNAGAILVRYVAGLQLPQELGAVALKLLDIHGHGTPQLWLQDDVMLHPYAHLMAILMLSLKLCCSLDAPARAAASAGHRDWQAWAKGMLLRARGPACFPVTTYEAIALDDADQDAYLTYLQGEVFAGADMPDALKDIGKAIKARGRQPMADSSPSAQQDLPPNAETSAQGLLNIEAAPSAYRAATKSASAHIQHLEPDYTAVLAACAAYLWVQPDFLHKLVLNTEMTMLSLERAAKQN